MPTQLVPNGIKLELNGVQNGIPIVNVLHVSCGVPITPTELEEAATTVANWFVLNNALFHTSYTLANVTATDLSVANGSQHIEVLLAGNVGTGSGGPAAANAAVVTSLRTAFTGRSFRGRIFLGGMAQSALADAQNITGAAALAYSNAIQDLIDALNTAGYVLSVLSRVSGGILRVTGILTEIISIITDTKIDSQRRRTAN